MTESALAARRYDGKSVLVTGGTGFIGTHLSRQLIAYGAEVVVLGRHAAALPAGVKLVLGDVRSEASVTPLIARRFDYVFNLAAYSGQVPSFTDHEQSLTTNCLGHLNLLEAIRTQSPETVMCFASSRLVYGRTQYLPVDEDHPKEARSFYGIHKRTCEEYCEYYALRFGVRSVALRISNPYGPHAPAGHHRYNIANWMIDELVAGREVAVYGRGEQLRDYIYIDDAVEALLRATADPRATGRIYNVGAGSGTSLIDFVRSVIDAVGSGRYKFVEWPQEFLEVETGDYAANISRIEAELGWRPRVSLREGIAMTATAAGVAPKRDAALGRAVAQGSHAEPELDAETLKRAA
jgi:nucleoside-diphosphate-sugar epimerase